MKRMFALVATLVAVTLPSLALASTWTLDTDHTYVGFKVRHMMVTYVKGSFEKFTGTVVIDDQDVTKSKVEVSIDTNSINTNTQKRDDHLRSPDFFDVAKYPTMTYVSKKVATNGAGKLQITGDLTLHGVTKVVVLDVEGPTAESKDPWGNIRKGATATAQINRKDFGLVWNKALETGGVLVGDEVTLVLEIEMIKK